MHFVVCGGPVGAPRYGSRLKITVLAWVRHTHAHFWQVHMRDFISKFKLYIKVQMYLTEMRVDMT